MSCTFTYKGKNYSKDFILRKLAKESLQVKNQDQSIQWLKDKLNMTDSEIVIIKGLIENKSLGRFKSDGKILLSSFADSNVAFHEAFHRVFRLYVSSEERNNYLSAFKTRKNWKNSIESYKELYPNLTEDELIEEYLADEFSDYVYNPQGYKIEQPIRNIFDRIINFIKSILGLNKKDIRKLYKDIQSGDFRNKSKTITPYLKGADKVEIGGYQLSISDKSEIVNEVVRQVIKRVAGTSAKTLDEFVHGKTFVNDFALLKKILQESIIPILNKTNPELSKALERDFVKGYQNTPLSSDLYRYYKDQINRIGLSSSLKESDSEIEDIEDFKSDQNDSETPNSKGEFTSSIEIDPKSNLSKRVKVLLASFVEPNETTSLGFPKQVQWSQAFFKITETMAGVPTEEFMDVLSQSDLSFKDQLLEFLNKEDFQSQLFRNDFISNLARTINNFNIAEIRDGDVIFFDANNNTKIDKSIKEWQSSTVKLISEYGFNTWKERVSSLLSNKNISAQDVKDIFGFDVSEEIDYIPFVYRISDVIKRSKFSDSEKPDLTNLYKSLDVYGTIKQLATAQSSFEDATDMMIYMMGKKIYGLGLNTHVTTVVNRLNYAQKQFTEEMSDLEKLEIIRKYAPYVVSPFNISYNEDGSINILNPWLKEILNGKSLKVNIVYNLQNEIGDQLEVADLNETDLYSLYLNGTLSGMNFSFKHSDRSIYYAYSFDGVTSPLVNPIPSVGFSTTKEGFAYLSNFIADQIQLEVDLAKRFKDNYVPFQYFGKSFDKPGISSILGEKRFNELIEGDEINADDKNKIYKEFIDNYYTTFLNELEKWKVIDRKTDKHLGLSKEKLSTYNNSIDLTVTTAFINDVINHISENRLFNNDMRFYKNPVDFFKRLAPTSSTGQILVNDQSTNDRIRSETAKLTNIEIHNPITNQIEVIPEYALAPDGYMRGVTLKENENYFSHLLDDAVDTNDNKIISELTGKTESKIFMLYEWNELSDRKDKKLSKADKERIANKINGYVDKYTKMNENDGQSYMNIIAFKNYMNRIGQWTEGMENVFQVEMQIMKAKSLDEIADIEIEIKGKKIKVFEVPEKQSFYDRTDFKTVEKDGKEVKIPFFQQFHPFHTLKTQYSGFSMSEQYLKETKEQLFDTSIFKTSMHILVPSSIIGTNLAMMNLSMMKTGTDVYHMGSANKVGGIDPVLSAKYYQQKEEFKNRKHLSTIAERGLEFYDENGSFNHDAIVENTDLMSYLFDVNFLKDQVKIGNKVKDKIKGSTQSLKIILSNLIVNGEERFPGAKEILEEYKSVINKIIQINSEELDKELSSVNGEFTTKDELKKSLLSSQLGKGAPENILNSIENFIDDPIFERMANKGKIENILYAIITNTAIVFNRSGNAYPQTASTGYEKAGSRNVKLEKNDIVARSNQDVLKFYNPHFNSEGEVTKVDPAEIILPLPDYWIEPILKKYKTRNIVKALNRLNKDIESGVVNNEVTVKGLRIPNQQLSSNDIFKVKKFNLPTSQAYAVVPSELVAKTGGDFDIDKINIYWNSFKDSETLNKSELENYEKYKLMAEELGLEPMDIETWLSVNGKKKFEAIDTDFLIENSKLSKKEWINKQNKSTLQARLLKLEKDILLHPRNAHHLFMPVTDDIIASSKTGVYKKVWVDLEGNPVSDSPDLINSLMTHTQVRNGIIFVKGKFGVGIVALGITGHSTSQADSVSINKVYIKDETAFSTMLKFEGYENEYGLDNYADNDGNTITEILSQLLTTQVDNVKNPVGIKLGINNQTLNVVEYLIRRRVSPTTIISFIKQPLIQEYLELQRINESVSNKTNGTELNKFQFINFVLDQYYTEKEIPEEKIPNTAFINQKSLEESIKNKIFDVNQIYYLNYFLELLDQSKALSNFSQEQTADTKAIINKSGYESVAKLRKQSEISEFIPIEKQYEVRTRGVLAPFTRNRENYNTKFAGMYITNHPAIEPWFSSIKEIMVSLQKTAAKKEKVATTIENDFILFFGMKYVMPKINGYYNDIFGLTSDKQSLAERVIEMKQEFPNNILLKAILPLLKTRKDELTNEYFDNIRLFERELTNIDTNDVLEAMKEIAEQDYELYRDLSVFTIMQSGFNNSPFNYLKVIPIGKDSERGKTEDYEYIINDLMKDIIYAVKTSINNGNIDQDMQQFFDEFQRNNVQFLRAKTWKTYPLNYYIGFDENKKIKLYEFDPEKRKSKNPATILGSTYNKRYGLNETKVVNEKFAQKANDTIEYTDYEDVTEQREYTPENITSLKPNEIFVFGSNAEGVHGKGAALIAKQKFGAKQGQSEGLQGNSYAIVTKKNWRVEKSSSLDEIGKEFTKFIKFAKKHPELKFYVTKLGSSLAGYTVNEIKDLWALEKVFQGIPENVILPKEYEVRDNSDFSNTTKQLGMFSSDNLVSMKELFNSVYDIIGGQNSGRSKNPLLFIDSIIQSSIDKNVDIGFVKNSVPEKSTFNRNKLLAFLESKMAELQSESEKVFDMQEDPKRLRNILNIERRFQLLYSSLIETKPEEFDSLANDNFTFPELEEGRDNKKECKGGSKPKIVK